MSISITRNALSKVKSILKKSGNDWGFLYSADSGGCNGFNFQLTLLDHVTHKNITNMKYHTVLEGPVYVDTVSEMFLQGTYSKSVVITPQHSLGFSSSACICISLIKFSYVLDSIYIFPSYIVYNSVRTELSKSHALT